MNIVQIKSMDEVYDHEFCVLNLDEVTLYKIKVDNISDDLGYIAITHFSNGEKYINLHISHFYQLNGYGRKAVEKMLAIFPIMHGHSVSESVDFWKKIGASFIDEELFILTGNN